MTSSDRLRSLLRDAVGPGLRVSERGTQYWFDEESAGYAEIDVCRGEAFLVVTVVGALEGIEPVVAQVWMQRAAEVWFVDDVDEEVVRVRADGTQETLRRGDLLMSPQLPGVAIPVASLFAVQ